MVEVVVDHHLDLVEDIHDPVEDGQDRVLGVVLDQEKGTEVVTGVQEIEKGHDRGKNQDLEIENVNHLETDEDLGPNLNVVQDLEVIKKIKNILPKRKKINLKNGKRKIRKKKVLLLYLKLRKKINQLLLKKKNLGQLLRQGVTLEVQDLLVNHQGEVVRLVEEKLLNL